VLVRGNVNISSDAILAVVRAAPGRPFLQAELLADEAAVRDMGFFQDARVLTRQVSDTEWQIVVEVLENPVIREVRITGNTVIPTEELLAVVTQEVGQVYNLRTELPTATAIADLYTARGYFANADIQPLEDSPNTLNIVVIERQVRDIQITGLTRTRPSVIRRLMKTQPGRAFSMNLWQIDQRRLMSTHWFEDIRVTDSPAPEIGKFDILMDVREARTAMITFGAALDPQSRLAGQLRYTDTNFRGLGQSVSVGVQQDTIGTGLGASIDYSNPLFDARDTTFTASLYTRVQSYFTGSAIGGAVSPTGDDRFDERRTGGALSFTRPIGRHYFATAGVSHEQIRTINLRTAAGADFIQQDGDLTVFDFAFSRDRRDVPLDPAQGDFLRLRVEPGLTNITRIGGNVGDVTGVMGRHDFLRTTLEYRTFFSRDLRPDERPDAPRPVIAARAKAGVIRGTVPFFEQFFAGGSDTVRGYPEQRFWGKRMFLTTIEYRHPLQRAFNLIAFADYGGAWGGYGGINEFTQSRDMNLHFGYGLGLGFRTPLGQIRIDFGFNQHGGSRTHFTIGGSF
jgi:outer membrane protein insertion porin family